MRVSHACGSAMLIKAVPTGRQFGDKREPEQFSVVVQGVRMVGTVDDRWDGPLPDSDPDHATHKPQYWRMTWLEQPKVGWP